MNKTNIEWTDVTWNPITGCTKGCNYCYALRLANGRLKERYLSNPNVAPGCDPNDPFSPRFWPDRLVEPCVKRTPSKIFVCSMAELFDPHIPNDWIKAILAVAWIHLRHTFQFLTKQPHRAAQFEFPPNAWVGVTIESVKQDYWNRLHHLSTINAPVKFISYEPLLTPIKRIPDFVDWIIIGAMTGPNAMKPKKQWVQALIDAADAKGIPVFLKDNLHWPEPRQEWPKGQ